MDLNNCILDGHNVEFVECNHGATEYRCLTCGETFNQYQENAGA